MTDYLAEAHKALQKAVEKASYCSASPEQILALADVARAYGELSLIEKGLIPARITEETWPGVAASPRLVP